MTVTSVGLSMPSDTFSVSGSPVTSSGTLAVSEVVQQANTFWRGPASGGPATPTWGAIVTADIPTVLNPSNLDNIYFVDGTTYATIQAAINAFGSNQGLVVIPSNYTGANQSSCPNNVSLLDLRNTITPIGNSSPYTITNLFESFNGSGTTNRIFNLGAEITASSGGTGNQGEGESVALFCGAERSGGSRPIWALNTVTQVDSGQKSNAAIGVEVDINNNSGTDSGGTSSSSDQMMGIQVISGGSNRPYIGVAVTADTANNTWLVGGLLGNFNKIGLQISNGDADCVGLKYIGSSGGGDTAILCQDSSGDNTLEVTGSGAVNIQAVSNPSAGYALTVRTGTDENFEVIPGESLWSQAA